MEKDTAKTYKLISLGNLGAPLKYRGRPEKKESACICCTKRTQGDS
jgi:hypothetical protein